MKRREEIKKLREEGMKIRELAEHFKVSFNTIFYNLNEEYRNRCIKRMKGYYKKLSDEKKKELYEKKKQYHKEYQKRRYNEDPEYRRKQIERVKRGKKK